MNTPISAICYTVLSLWAMVYLQSCQPSNTATKSLKIKENFEYVAKIKTKYGNIHTLLYDATPKHKKNFIDLAHKGFYDSTTFHRVIQGFMIQGGDPNSKDALPGNDGQGGPGYTLDAEIVQGLLHERGALAAARKGDQVNPERKSNGSQFYIVQGQRGAHHLDGSYTVFGHVIKGMDVVDEIARQRVGRNHRPAEDVLMRMEVVPIKKTKLKEVYPNAKLEQPELPQSNQED